MKFPHRARGRKQEGGGADGAAPTGVARGQSLRLRAVLTAVVLVGLSTGLCGLLSSRVAERALREALHRDASLLSDTVARAVGRRAGGQPAEGAAGGHGGQLDGRFIDQLTLDERVAFVVLSDAEGRVIDRRISHAEAWSDYVRLVPPDRRLSPLRVNQPYDLSRRSGPPMTLVTRPVWVGGDSDPRAARVAGYVGLGMVDATAERMVGRVQLATIAVVFVACLLSVPPILLAARWWSAPLREMLEATVRLARGAEPTPLRVRRRDEVGALARSFNVMAERLAGARSQLVEANERLEGQVEHRTEQLREANEKLQAQMRDKDEFIRAITHDLNAPVRNIAGMTRMLLKKYERQFTEDAVSKLNRIAANAKAESELLADLLELSRLRTDGGKWQPIDLGELLESLRESLSYDLEAKGMTFEVEGELPTLRGDRNRIRQLFQNLLDNAIKYMPADQPVRRVSIGAAREGHQWVFQVSDTGRGIAAKDHDRVFQVFQRARYSGDHDAAGRGVGLASVKTIVETYGGQVWIESEPGDGTTFYFTLDLAFEPDVQTGNAVAAAGGGWQGRTPPKAGRPMSEASP